MNSTKIVKKKDDYSVYLTFFSKKTERIVSAIYLVTENFSKDESLRWQLRKKALQLLSDTMSLNENNLSYRDKTFSHIRRAIFEILSFLEVSLVANIISEMNAEIFKRELEQLLKFIDDGFDEMGRQNLLSLRGDFFKVEGGDLEPKTIGKKEQILHKGHSQGQRKVSFRQQKDIENKGNITNVKKRETRKSQILGLFNKGQKLTIKDISQVVDDCGEKTIQRELVSLLNEGLLRKEGERRWSTYSLS